MASPPVVFDPVAFVSPGMFPEFSPLNPAELTGYFTRATGSIIGNSTTNPAFGDGNLPYLINLATAHVAWLMCAKDQNGNPTSAQGGQVVQLVGRINSAGQGSVNVQTEWPASDPSVREKYLMQTKYGAELLAALQPYWTARYAAQPTIVIGGRFRNPYLSGGRAFWGPAGPWGG